MKPLLTFNFTSTKPTTARGCQILPNKFQPININNYHGPTQIDDLLIHSGYTCIPWKESEVSFGSRTRLMLSTYMALLKKTGATQILVHAPKNQNEYNMLNLGVLLLVKVNATLMKDENIRAMMKNKGINSCVCVENVYNTLTKTFKSHDEMLKYTINCFDFIIGNKLDIVIDTAHCFANGLNVDDVIHLLNKYKGHYRFIHLNGNSRESFKPDVHTLIITEGVSDVEPNLIKDCDKLMNFISTLTDVVLICEIIYKNYDYWYNLSQKYKLDIITKDEFDKAF